MSASAWVSPCAVAASASPCAYLLWGAHAQAKAGLIETTAARHGRDALVLQANHPSPLSASRPPVPFIGCGHFGTAQRWLTWQDLPLPERGQQVCACWALHGYGAPAFVLLFYALKVALYIAGWSFFCSFSPYLFCFFMSFCFHSLINSITIFCRKVGF